MPENVFCFFVTDSPLLGVSKTMPLKIMLQPVILDKFLMFYFWKKMTCATIISRLSEKVKFGY